MAITLDGVLSVVIPVGIFAFLFFLFYSKFKDAFDLMFRKLKELLFNMGGKTKDAAQVASYKVVYRT